MQKNPLFTSTHIVRMNYSPLRNYLCPHYDECMTKAAMDNLLLYCSYCSYKDSRMDTFVLSTPEIMACVKLMREVFAKELAAPGFNVFNNEHKTDDENVDEYKSLLSTNSFNRNFMPSGPKLFVQVL